MKKLALLLALLATPASAQWFIQIPRDYAVGGEPTCNAARNGRIIAITDGADATDCTVGSGAETVLCQCDGTTWTAGGGAAISAGDSNVTVVDAGAGEVQFNLDGVLALTIGADSGSFYATFSGGIATSDAAVTDVTIDAADAQAAAVTNQDGGHIILTPGANATGGGADGIIQLNLADGNAGAIITGLNNDVNKPALSIGQYLPATGTNWIGFTAQSHSSATTASVWTMIRNVWKTALYPDRLEVNNSWGARLEITLPSVTEPAYGFKSDPGLGMYRVGADQLGFTAGAELVVDVLNNGTDSTVTVTEDSTQAGAGFIYEDSGGTDLVTMGPGTVVALPNTTVTDVLTVTPQATAPATCSIGDLYIDTSGAACACSATNTWSNMHATGSCA